MPKTACANVSQGGLDFRIESTAASTFQSARIVSLPVNPKGTLIYYAVYQTSSGNLHYDDVSVEPFINNEYDDFFYYCNMTYTEISNFAKAKGFQTLASVIPHLTVEMWLTEPDVPVTKLVGLAVKNQNVNEFAVQCF